jgi:hypothetical protein
MRSYQDSKNQKDSLIYNLYKNFAQNDDGEKNDTLMKCNIDKIRIKKIKRLRSYSDIYLSHNNFNFEKAKQQLNELIEHFFQSFNNNNKTGLIASIKNLSHFSRQYHFDYITKVTSNWLQKLENKEIDDIKNIGNFNNIKDIFNKMLEELKKQEYNYLNSNINESNNSVVNEYQDLFNSKEIVPLKIDIEVKKNLDLNKIENIIENLDKTNLKNSGDDNINNDKLINNKIYSKKKNELESYTYPFVDNSSCYIF